MVHHQQLLHLLLMVRHLQLLHLPHLPHMVHHHLPVMEPPMEMETETVEAKMEMVKTVLIIIQNVILSV